MQFKLSTKTGTSPLVIKSVPTSMVREDPSKTKNCERSLQWHHQRKCQSTTGQFWHRKTALPPEKIRVNTKKAKDF